MADYASGFGELGKNLLISSILRRQAQEAHKQALTQMLTPIMVNMMQHNDRIAMQEKVARINAESAKATRESSLQEAEILAATRRYNTDKQYEAKLKQIEATKEKPITNETDSSKPKPYLEYHKRILKASEKTQTGIESNLKSKRKEYDKLVKKEKEITPGTLEERDYLNDLELLKNQITSLESDSLKHMQEIFEMYPKLGYELPSEEHFKMQPDLSEPQVMPDEYYKFLEESKYPDNPTNRKIYRAWKTQSANR